MNVFQNISWEEIEATNKDLCEKANSTAFGRSSENYEATREKFLEIQGRPELLLAEACDELRVLHKSAPFLNFNGNTFSALGKELIDEYSRDFASPEVRSIIGHHIAGVAILSVDELEKHIPTKAEIVDSHPYLDIKRLYKKGEISKEDAIKEIVPRDHDSKMLVLTEFEIGVFLDSSEDPIKLESDIENRRVPGHREFLDELKKEGQEESRKNSGGEDLGKGTRI